MSVQPGPTEKRYEANGVSLIYTVPFLVIEAGDLQVLLNGAQLTSGFTHVGVGLPISYIEFTIPPTGDLLLQLSVPFQRLVDYQENGDFLSSTVNRDFDRIWQVLKQLLRTTSRSPVLGINDIDGQGFYRAKGNGLIGLASANGELTAAPNWKDVLDYVTQILETGQGPINNAANIYYTSPDGTPHVVQDMSEPNGLGLVGYDDTGTFPLSSAGFALQLMRKGSVFIAPGGPGVDDSPRINAAAAAAGVGGTVFFTRGDYLINSKVTQLDSQAWRSHGGQRAINLVKSANCDMLQTSNLSKLESINLEGAGATYTGKGIISIGFSVEIKGCRANLMKGAALSFPGNAGGTNLIAFEGSTFEPLTVPGIDFGGISTVRPIFLNGVWLSGGYIDVTGSGNGCSMSNFYITGIKHGAGAGLMHFSNGRVGNATVPFLLSGGGSTFTGVSFAGDIQIQSGVGMEFAACAASSISEDSASNSNKFFARGTITPAWTQASGSGPTLGNGSLVMNYVRDGNQVTVQLALTFGSTTYAGDAAAPWSFGLPFVASPNINVDGMAGVAFDLSGPTDFAVSGQIPAGTSQLNFGRNGSGVREGTPFTWAAGDKLTCSFTYIAR
ncbi:hypothetical protein QQ999_15890 [Pseudomonas fluorescens]